MFVFYFRSLNQVPWLNLRKGFQNDQVPFIGFKQKTLVISKLGYLFGELFGSIVFLILFLVIFTNSVFWNDIDKDPAKLLNCFEHHINVFRILGEQ